MDLVEEFTKLKEELQELDREEARLKGEVATYDTQIRDGLAKMGVSTIEEAQAKKIELEQGIQKAIEGAKRVIEAAASVGNGQGSQSAAV